MVDGILGAHRGSLSADGAKNPLILRPGQILPGIVLEVKPEHAVVLLNGINVVAELKTSVIPGEKLMLQVGEQLPDGRMVLQKVASGQTEEGPAITQRDLESVLQYLGVKSSSLNEAIVRELLELHSPVTQRALQALSSFAIKNNLSAGQIPALTWLWARGLPITQESVVSLASLMDNGFPGSKLGELVQVLKGIPAENIFPGSSNNEMQGLGPGSLKANAGAVTTGANPVPGDGPGNQTQAAGPWTGEKGIILSAWDIPKDPTGRLTQTIGRLLLFPEESLSHWVQKLRDTMQNLGLNHERDVLRFLEQLGGRPDGSQGIKDDPGGLFQGEKGTLKALLMELVKPGGQPFTENISLVADKVVKDITGFQLLNIAGRQEADGITTFVPGWVALGDSGTLPFFLKVKRYFGGSGSSQDYRCQVLFFISTREMGEVVCRLALERGFLTCGFTVRGEEECRLLDSMLPFLEERFRSLPWKIVIYPSKITGSEEIAKAWYEETFLANEAGFKSLDARV